MLRPGDKEKKDGGRKYTQNEESESEESENDEMFRRAIESYRNFSATYDSYVDLNRIDAPASE